MAMSSKRLLIAAACAALGGCSTVYSHYGDEDPGLGEAVKYDQAVQVINPAPVYAANSTQPGSNGDVGAKAVERYRTDKVKQVQEMQTTSGSSGSGSSSGSGPR
jgi:hypothetical protein